MCNSMDKVIALNWMCWKRYGNKKWILMVYTKGEYSYAIDDATFKYN